MKFVYYHGIPYVKTRGKIKPQSFVMQGRVFKPGMEFDVIGEGRTSFSIGVPLEYVGIKDNYALFKPRPRQLTLFEDETTRDWYIALAIVRTKRNGPVHCLLVAVQPGAGYDVRWKTDLTKSN